jgi:autotransporter-associated beta strand protein
MRIHTTFIHAIAPGTYRVGRARLTMAGILLAASLAFTAHAQTGFNQTGAGPFDYNLSGNWFEGTINGLWDSALTLAAAQTATFGANTTLTTGLDFRYDGAQNLTLRSDGVANRSLTLGGNLLFDTVNNTRTITLGSTTANQGLNVDLGGAVRTFAVGGIAGSTRTLTFHNDVSNGGLLLNGGGAFNFNGNNTLGSLRIQNSAFRITGNSAANTSTIVGGALTIDGIASSVASTADNIGGIATITLTPNASRNTALSASSLVRENKGVVFFRGTNLGGTLGANNVANITFAAAPVLVGGGVIAETTNISILSWAVGATTAAGNANTFVTYDATNGIRPLNTSTEFQNYADGYSGAVTGTANSNTRIASGSVTLTGNNIVNSLFVGESGDSTLAGNGGTLTVTSGAVFLNSPNMSLISANLNFGVREGVIGYTQGKASTISGGIAGSGGVTVYQAQPNTAGSSAGTGVSFTGAATFTGDFTVNSRAGVTHSDFLPQGSRTGNLVVNSLLTLAGLGTDSRGYTMNGLYGNGRLSKGFSGAGLFRIGDNDSDGNFSGVITDGGSTVVQKIGAGTQIFSGANSHNGATQILGGTLDVSILANGLSNSGVGRTSNLAANLLLNGGTLKYSGATTGTDRLFTVGTSGGGLNASGSGAVLFSAVGNNVSAEAANRAGARTLGSDVVTGVTNFADLIVGARVTGTGITAGTTITAIDTVGGTITLSAVATANSSASMSFSSDRILALSGSNAGANTLSGVLANSSNAGALGVTKSGAGTWVLAGANTYTGATTVNEGKLVVASTGSIASGSAVTVNNGGTLAGTGTVAGMVTVNSGGTLSPGSSPGLQNFGGLVLNDGGHYNWQILDAQGAAGTGYDSYNLTGSLNLGGLTGAIPFNINLWSLSGIGPDVNGNALNFNPAIDQSWTLIATPNAIAGFDASFFAVNVGAKNGTAGFANALGGGSFSVGLADGNTDLVLNFIAIPEPSTLLLLGGGLLAAALGLRGRKR